MARPVWSGVLSFGLVSIPVGLYTATDSHTLHFHQLERGTADRIRNRRVNQRTGEEVDLKDIVKGFDTGDEYVIVEPEELEEIAPGRSKTLEITGFVDLDEVEPIFFDRTYYLGPKGKEYGKVYSVLTQALAKANRAGIATFVMRQREYLVTVQAEDDLLTCHTLHWADEIRDPRAEIDSLPGRTKATAKELRLAEQVIDALAVDWDPGDYQDTYRDKVAALIEAKQAGETVEKAELPGEPTNVVDLMDALRASIDRTGAAGRKRSRKGRPGKAEGLQELTKTELYEKASAAGVNGRSTMTRDELIDALRAA
ncbi:Ku protein [Streptomyces sp. NBC_01353]|uniref:non-homologous end joining protein Ku n=1 Tax=Streptomyces sp. NBC_01353 TaxID=2903835 RepID=UPI002E34AA1C|nr:Ku protein [Streptomyces sp. NBC_01353]